MIPEMWLANKRQKGARPLKITGIEAERLRETEIKKEIIWLPNNTVLTYWDTYYRVKNLIHVNPKEKEIRKLIDIEVTTLVEHNNLEFSTEEPYKLKQEIAFGKKQKKLSKSSKNSNTRKTIKPDYIINKEAIWLYAELFLGHHDGSCHGLW